MPPAPPHHAVASSPTFRKRAMLLRMAAAAGVASTYAPPAVRVGQRGRAGGARVEARPGRAGCQLARKTATEAHSAALWPHNRHAGRAIRCCRAGWQRARRPPKRTRLRALAPAASPDAGALALHGLLAAKRARVPGARGKGGCGPGWQHEFHWRGARSGAGEQAAAGAAAATDGSPTTNSLGVLADLNLLDDLTQRGAEPRAVLADNAHLLRAALRSGRGGRRGRSGGEEGTRKQSTLLARLRIATQNKQRGETWHR